MSDLHYAKAARALAAEKLDEAVALASASRPADALLSFEDALDAERWAVYYETRGSGGGRAHHPPRRP